MHCELLWIKVSDTYTAVKLGQDDDDDGRRWKKRIKWEVR